MTLPASIVDPAVFRTRRAVLANALAVGCTSGLVPPVAVGGTVAPASTKRTRFAVSTYSFWQFNREDLRD
ncbi:MAG: hypothetical protein ACKPJD_32140, partial [Planctomycetaceae bacterium]